MPAIYFFQDGDGKPIFHPPMRDAERADAWARAAKLRVIEVVYEDERIVGDYSGEGEKPDTPCLSGDHQVLTDTGWQKIGDIVQEGTRFVTLPLEGGEAVSGYVPAPVLEDAREARSPYEEGRHAASEGRYAVMSYEYAARSARIAFLKGAFDNDGTERDTPYIQMKWVATSRHLGDVLCKTLREDIGVEPRVLSGSGYTTISVSGSKAVSQVKEAFLGIEP